MNNLSLEVSKEENWWYLNEANEEIADILEEVSYNELKDWNFNKLLSREEECLLTNLVQNWEKAKKVLKIIKKDDEFLRSKIKIAKLAIQILIISNQGLIHSIAKQLSWKKIGVDDLIQEGNMWIMTAALKFDPKKWNKFSTYSSWWIRQRILLYFKKNKLMWVPVKVAGDVILLKKIIQDLNLNIDELSENKLDKLAIFSNFTKEYIIHLISVIRNENLLSMDWENEDGGNFIHSYVSDNKQTPEENYFQTQREKWLRDNIETFFFEKTTLTFKKYWIIICLRNNIMWLKENIIQELIDLTQKWNLNPIERNSINLINLYLENRTEFLETLRYMLISYKKDNKKEIGIISELYDKVLYLWNNLDLLVKEFEEKNNITTLLFCLLEEYNQRKRNISSTKIRNIFDSLFTEKKNNISKYFDFMSECLFLYSYKMKNKEISKENLKELYIIYMRNMGASPTLQDIWILFSITRERVRQLEEKGMEKLKRYIVLKNM